jgi:ornithine cyclodeaminase/alanine dehydrogenase-like protein (mu-crystallin family)
VVAIKDEVQRHVPPWQAVADLISLGELSEADVSIEMADVLLGRRPGRTSEDEIIALLNPGCGIYDVAIASYVYRRAQEKGLGTPLPQ